MRFVWFGLCFFFIGSSYAQERFKTGPVFTEFGQHAAVDSSPKFDDKIEFKVAFDVAEGALDGKMNRGFHSLARFINMHVANGVPIENIHLALVVHGKASHDLLNAAAYQAVFNKINSSHGLITKLLENNVKVILCGQSAAVNNIHKTDLIEGVQMALSAMTAHALLDAQGYSLNPF